MANRSDLKRKEIRKEKQVAREMTQYSLTASPEKK